MHARVCVCVCVLIIISLCVHIRQYVLPSSVAVFYMYSDDQLASIHSCFCCRTDSEVNWIYILNNIIFYILMLCNVVVHACVCKINLCVCKINLWYVEMYENS